MRKTIFCLVLFLVLGSNVFTQNKSDNILDKKIYNIKMTDENSLMVLDDIVSRYDLNLGIEMSPDDSSFKKLSEIYEIKDGTVKDVLNVFIKLHPQYQWVIKGRFINIYPIDETQKERVLDIKISRMLVENENTQQISYKILNHPDVLEFLKELEIKPNNDSSAFGNLVKTPVFSFEQKNQTIRNTLKYMLQNNIIKYWLIYRNVGNSKYIKLVIR